MKRIKWRYQLDEPLVVVTKHLNGVSFSNNWIIIQDGFITIREGYAWNGASPKWSFLDVLTIGTPDGRLYLGKPITYKATAVHDVLTQFKEEASLSREVRADIFSELLEKVDFKLRRLYVWAVRTLGP